MAEKDIIMATQNELKRLYIIKKVLDKELKQTIAAEILNLSNRQVRRIARRISIEGDKAIIHKSRGKLSKRSISKTIKDNIINLYKNKYDGFGPTLATEKLFEIDNIKISKETLRNWLIEHGLWTKRQKRRKHRKWRQRKHNFGEMIQMDGSTHKWFEERGPECTLMAYIDDATNTVFARFYEHEGTIPAMDSSKRYIAKYGLPISMYLDRHTTYKSNAKPTIEEQLNNMEPKSQFERAAKELSITLKYAYSPQAKGRIERLFKTLQDRLIKEMRLKGISTIKEANKFLRYYLPLYNKRFSFKPKERGDLHRIPSKDINIDNILCIKTTRTLRNDFTIVHNKKLYQIEEFTFSKKVTVLERVDGKMLITYNNKSLKYKEILNQPKREKIKKSSYVSKATNTYNLPMDFMPKASIVNEEILYDNSIC